MPAHIGQLRQVFSTGLPTRRGVFHTLGFERLIANGSRRTETAIAMIMGDLTERIPLVRVHSQCITGEVLGSLRCDCRDQLELALQAISDEGCGVVIYEHQEGRGIGLMAKLQAYALQDTGLDTIDANHALGFDADCRDFGLPAAILNSLGISRVRLMTNNPHKVHALRTVGIDVSQVACETVPTPHSVAYLRAKRERMGHALTLGINGRFNLAGFPATNAADPAAKVGLRTTEAVDPFATIEEAANALREGRMVVVVDDESRENEGDLMMAAEMVTPEAINFMAMHGRGLICLAMSGERLDELNLCPMAAKNSALGGTAFTVSIDLQGPEITTGISAYDRAQTIRAAVDPRSHSSDFAVPGHVFPLRARQGGVLERRGHTEAAVDLAGLAGFQRAGVICEIVNDNGTMARGPELIRFCRKHGLLLISVAALARYRMSAEFDELMVVATGA